MSQSAGAKGGAGMGVSVGGGGLVGSGSTQLKDPAEKIK